MAYIDTEVAKLIPESKKGGKNVALGVAGWFLLVPWFFMDFSDAEKIEIRAYRERYLALEQLWERKGCSEGDKADDVAVPPEEAMTETQKRQSLEQRLKVLDELKESGLISDEEYETKRDEILSDL
jgi:hypothetical protein